MYIHKRAHDFLRLRVFFVCLCLLLHLLILINLLALSTKPNIYLLTYRGPSIMIYSYNERQRDALCLKLI